MAFVSFLWHLHQPSYRTADRVSHAPWVALHAGGAYTTLARAILSTGGRGQVVNIVPTLLEQLEAYRDGTVVDPVVEALRCPASELDRTGRQTVVDWAFHVTTRQLERYPRLRELAARRHQARRRERRDSRYGLGDLRDLQILTILAHAGPQAWADPRLEPLHAKGRQFTADDHRLATRWLAAQPGEVVELWRRLAGQGGVEVATSPYAHPIMPLLIDSAVVGPSWAPHQAPSVPPFRYPDDARRQLDAALAFMRGRGFDPRGCWPPEGSVSAEAVTLYGDAGVRWLVTDEGILERSLGRPLRRGVVTSPDLYRPWRLADGGPAILFRDRWLSDEIGFKCGHWENERLAAAHVVEHLTGLARSLSEDATVVVALDGENPWLHFPEGGAAFLDELLDRLSEDTTELKALTLDEVAERRTASTLASLHPGSWINGNFSTWIGHPEKTAAWEVLAAIRAAVGSERAPQCPSLLVAEASDWFWWLGDDNPTPLAPLYDRIFRRHLEDLCSQARVEPPVDLGRPLKAVTRPLPVPLSRVWPPPVLDGRVTSYFEWSLAAWVTAGEEQPLRRLALWADGDELHLLVEGRGRMSELLADQPLSVVLQSPEGTRLELEVSSTGCDHPRARCSVNHVVEMSVPWRGQGGHRLEVRLGGCSLPEGAVLLVEPLEVDEELPAVGAE